VAGITMLGAALMAFTQDDIKRVLAYSTISQLAYMIAGMSMGPAGRTGAFFHLFTHAFFKRCCSSGRARSFTPCTRTT
jgi:NADH-quinone oxidoreductase subunit L